MSLFCEANQAFDPLDPDQSLSSGSTKPSSHRSRRHSKRLSESAPDADSEGEPRKALLALTPWKQDAGRSWTYTTLCGDGLFYAAGGNGAAGACINPGHV